jgi:hypothetical protein
MKIKNRYSMRLGVFISALFISALLSTPSAAAERKKGGGRPSPVVIEDDEESRQERKKLPDIENEDSDDPFFEENNIDRTEALLEKCLRLPGFRVVSVTAAGDPLRITVRFNRRPDKKQAADPANYLIDDGAITVKKAVPDGIKIVLNLNSPLTEDSHTLLMKNIPNERKKDPVIISENFDYVDISDDMSLWFRSDRKVVMDKNANVFAWLDQSGNGRVLRSIPSRKGGTPVYTEDAIKSNPSLRFERNLMILSHVRNLETDMISWFVVFKADDSAKEQNLVSNSYARGAKMNSKDLWGIRIAENAVSPYSRNSQGGLVPTSHILDNEWHFLSSIWGANDRISSLTDIDPLQVSGEPADAAPGKHLFFNIGARLQRKRHFFSGEVAEIIIYPRELSVNEREKVEKYLALKYFDNSDTDRDGLPDEWELLYFGNLDQNADGDPDGDGLTNLQEYLAGADPTKTDTDGDGISDAEELRLGLDPLKADQDNDGLSDGWEIKYFGNLNQTAEGDPDTDTVNNIAEFKQGRHPNAGSKTDTENKLKLEVLLPIR